MSRRFKSEGPKLVPEARSRGIWLFGRPQSDSITASNGDIGLGRWGILVTDLSLDIVKTLALRHKTSITDEIDLGDYIHVGDDIDLGTLWELIPVGNRYTVNGQQEFKLSHMQEHWRSFSGRFISETTLANEEIQLEGNLLDIVFSLKAIRIIEEHPDKWISENCRTFAQSLLKFIDSEFNSSESIKAISDMWLTLATVPPSVLTSYQSGTFGAVSDEIGVSVRRHDTTKHFNPPAPADISIALSSQRRVLRELDEVNWFAVDGISAYCDELDKIQCFIAGPADCPYAGTPTPKQSRLIIFTGGIFELEIMIPFHYPYQEPTCRFITVIYHPWVNDSGLICMKGIIPIYSS